MAIANEDEAKAAVVAAAAEEEMVEMIVIQLLKIACVPKGPLKRCYADLLQEFQDLKIVSAAAAALSQLEFRALFEELFKLHIHESLDSPTAAFWQGSGAFGIVYKCKSKLDERIYALKLINVPENAKKEDKLKVLREVITLSQLEHPQMDKFLAEYEAGDLAEASSPARNQCNTPFYLYRLQTMQPAPSNIARKLYIQMEYCEEKLSDYLADKNRFDLLNCKQIFRQLVAALAHIHSLGIVHRDLAPKNVLLNAELSVKLGDFGLSKGLDGKAGDSKVGTPWYMAPEVGSGSPTSTKADIYALGVIAIELAGFMEPLAKHKVLESLKSGVVLPASIPRDVTNLILKLLAKDPASRPSAAELLEDQEWASFPGTSILPSRCLTGAAPPSTVAGTTA